MTAVPQRVDPHIAVDVRTQDDPAGVDNPYWQAVRSLPGDRFRFDDAWQPDGHRIDSPRRHTFVNQYAWAIPYPAAVTFIADTCDGRGVVEIGAGTGCWAWRLAQRGVDVVAYDKNPPDEAANHWHHTDADGRMPTWHPIVQGDPERAGAHPDRVLFLCWPPYDDPMAAYALAAYAGDLLIYIGEARWGCTGDEGFHEALAVRWDEVADHSLVQWSGLHDWVTVYRRRP